MTAQEVLATPSVRKLLISEVSPKAGSIETQKLAQQLTDSSKWQEGDYIKAAASGSGELKAKSYYEVPWDLGIRPSPFWYVYGNSTGVGVIYPEVRVRLPGGMTIEAQTGTNIPTKNGTTAMNWSSVDMFYQSLGGLEQVTMGLRALPEALKVFSGIADALSRWGYERMVRIGEPLGYKVSKPWPLEMNTVGIRDRILERYFQLFCDEKKLGELLAYPGAHEKLSVYFTAAGLDGGKSLESYVNNCCHFVTKASVRKAEVMDGLGLARMLSPKLPLPVLYIVHNIMTGTGKPTATKAVGIGFDPSAQGNLAAEASDKAMSFLKQWLEAMPLSSELSRRG